MISLLVFVKAKSLFWYNTNCPKNQILPLQRFSKNLNIKSIAYVRS